LIPPSWSRLTLREIGKLHCGQSPRTADVNRDGFGTRYVTGPEQWDGVQLRLDKWTTDPRRVVPEGCVFVTVKGAGVGTIFPGVAAAIGRDVYAYEPAPHVSPRFIQHALRLTVSEVLRNARGDIPGLSKNHILDHVVGIPPRHEQDRIVAKLEELLSHIDAGVAAVERARANLKRYRAAVLNTAVEGKLTEQWRAGHPDAEPASVLLERILAERRTRWEEEQLRKHETRGSKPPKGWREEYRAPCTANQATLPLLPSGWCWTTADQLTDETRAITYGVVKLGDHLDAGVPTLRSSNVRHLELDLARVKRISEDIAGDYKRTILRGGEILVTVRGTLGGVVVVPSSCAGYNISREVAMLALVEPRVGPALAIFIASPRVQNWILKNTRGIAYTGINIETLKRMPLPLAPLAELDRVERAVMEQLTCARRASEESDMALARSRTLRQAILKAAFRGELTKPETHGGGATDDDATACTSTPPLTA